MVMGMWRPVMAVAGYMVLVYCKLSSYYPFLGQMHSEALFAGLILVRIAINGNLFRNLSIGKYAINKYLLLLILCVGLSFVFAWDRKLSWDTAIYHYIKTLLLYVMIVGAIESKADLKVFVWSFMFMFLYLAYEPMYGFVSGIGGSRQIYGTNYIAEIGILSGHVALANNMNQMLPIAWFLFWASVNKWEKISTAACLVVFFLALVGSGSRGGVVGLAVTGFMIVWMSKQRVKSAMIMLVILAAMALGTGAGSSIKGTAERIDSYSIRSRLIGLTHGLGMIRKGNYLGVGPGCYLLARRHYFSYRMESHNIYGQIMGDLGIPGIIATFLLMREIFRCLIRLKKRVHRHLENDQFFYYLMMGIQVSLVSRLVISMGSHGLYYFYWYVMAALVVVSQRLFEQEHQT